MCGIFGILNFGKDINVIGDTIFGLKHLEYRGYDSSGIGFVKDNGRIKVFKRSGKIANLESVLRRNSSTSHIAISHTRWATHGVPNTQNAHPHRDERVALVHNGIIENYIKIKTSLEAKGVKFTTETDTEAITRLISDKLAQGLQPKDAVYETTKELEGNYAIAVIFESFSNLMIIAKNNSPILIGYGEKSNFISSDFRSIASFTKKVSILEDKDIAILDGKNVEIYNENKKVTREIKEFSDTYQANSKEGYEYFMMKEIMDQPNVVKNILASYVSFDDYKINLPIPDFANSEKITIIACGSSYYAGNIGKYLIESIASISVETDVASEFRYRNPPMKEGGVAIFISQSGETADTIAAIKYAKSKGQKIISLTNVEHSSIATMSDYTINLLAGSEVSVAATKSFVAQVLVIFLIAIKFAGNKISSEQRTSLLDSLNLLPNQIGHITQIEHVENVKIAARAITYAGNVLYVGRGVSYPIVCEGALKLKELSYIPAEAIASGELKHGTIALIDKKSQIVSVIGDDNLLEKSISNIQEILAREGRIIAIIPNSIRDKFNKIENSIIINVGDVKGQINFVIISAINVQLLAYYTARKKGCNIDMPKNLAKSVTVE